LQKDIFLRVWKCGRCGTDRTRSPDR